MRTVEIQRLVRLLDTYYYETGNSKALQLIQQIREKDTVQRHAGRKPKYSTEIQKSILSMHDKGMTMRQISTNTGCSLGYIQNLISTNRSHGCRKCTENTSPEQTCLDI